MGIDTLPEIEFLPDIRTTNRRRANSKSKLSEINENFTNIISNNTSPRNGPQSLIHSPLKQKFLEKIKLTRMTKHKSKKRNKLGHKMKHRGKRVRFYF